MQHLKSSLIIFILFLFVACSITFPLILHLGDRVMGMIERPGLQGELFFERNILYNAQKGNLCHWHITDLVNYPEGQNLGAKIAHSFHFFLSLPLSRFFGPFTSYNILAIITLSLNGLMMYLLARDFFSSKAIAFSSGLFFMFNSYTLLKMNQGFLQKIVLFWIPLYFLSLFRLRKEKKIGYLILSSLFLFFLQGTYAVYAYYALIFTVILVIYDLIEKKGSFFFAKKVALVIALFLIMVSACSWLLGFGFRPHGTCHYKLSPVIFDGCLDLLRAFRFHPYHSLNFPTHLTLGLSLVAVGLGIFTALKKPGFPRFLLFSAAIFIVIAMGPYFYVRGTPLEIFGHRILLPYYVLYDYFPYGHWLVFPIRVFPILNICFALLIGFGLTLLTQKISRLTPILVTILFIIIYTPESFILFPELLPPVLSKPEIPEFYTKIKEEEFQGLLNLPVSPQKKNLPPRDTAYLYCYYATLGQKKIMNSFDYNTLPVPFPRDSDGWQIKKEFVDYLSRWDVRYIVIHKKLLGRDGSLVPFLKGIEWLASFCGSPVDYVHDGLLVYEVPS